MRKALAGGHEEWTELKTATTADVRCVTNILAWGKPTGSKMKTITAQIIALRVKKSSENRYAIRPRWHRYCPLIQHDK